MVFNSYPFNELTNESTVALFIHYFIPDMRFSTTVVLAAIAALSVTSQATSVDEDLVG